MRMIDEARKHEIKKLMLYLRPHEAEELIRELHKLLIDPERKEHFHLNSWDDREMSCSIITDKKLSDISGYNKLEQQVLSAK